MKKLILNESVFDMGKGSSSGGLYIPKSKIGYSVDMIVELRRMQEGSYQSGHAFVEVKKGTPKRYSLTYDVVGTGALDNIVAGYTDDEVEALDYLRNGQCSFGDFSDVNEQGYSDEEILDFLKRHNLDLHVRRHEGGWMSVDEFEKYVENKKKEKSLDQI